MTSPKPEAVSLSERMDLFSDYEDPEGNGYYSRERVEYWRAEVRSLEQRLAQGVAGLVPEGWHIGTIVWDYDLKIAYADLEQDAKPWGWAKGTGPSIEDAVRDAAGRVTK